MLEVGADGLNFDYEEPIAPGAPAAAAYTSLVAAAAAALRAARRAGAGAGAGAGGAAVGASNATSTPVVTVDVPWSPYDVDGRSYDWRGLAAAADALFVMAYDVQSSMLGRCAAAANAPLDAVKRGVDQWLALGVPREKLILGLPWYGERKLRGQMARAGLRCAARAGASPWPRLCSGTPNILTNQARTHP